MGRVFLDANVLYSAGYKDTSALRELWELTEVELLTSLYAMEEAAATWLSTNLVRSRASTG